MHIQIFSLQRQSCVSHFYLHFIFLWVASSYVIYLASSLLDPAAESTPVLTQNRILDTTLNPTLNPPQVLDLSRHLKSQSGSMDPTADLTQYY